MVLFFIFLLHDVEEALKIIIGTNKLEDTVAYTTEKRSLHCQKRMVATLNTEAPEVHIFSWWLAITCLQRKNKWCRTLELRNACSICGNGIEDSLHAAVECTKARSLHYLLRDFWILPK
jgi:hypothetical protein